MAKYRIVTNKSYYKVQKQQPKRYGFLWLAESSTEFVWVDTWAPYLDDTSTIRGWRTLEAAEYRLKTLERHDYLEEHSRIWEVVREEGSTSNNNGCTVLNIKRPRG